MSTEPNELVKVVVFPTQLL